MSEHSGYSTQTAIELSFAAKRRNGKYIKQSQGNTYSNKELIMWTLARQQGTAYFPKDFEFLEVNDEDRAAKEAADKHMRRYIMLALGGLNQFESDMFAAYSNETTPPNQFGFIAYFPYFVERELEELTYRNRLKKEFHKSQQIGKKGDRIEDMFEVLKCIPLHNSDTFLYFKSPIPNLFVFTHMQQFSVGDFLALKGKINSYQVERQTGTPVTRLNYVKVQQVKEHA